MKILAIDTSSKNATVAITENEEKLIELNNSDEKTHSQKLMPMIDEAFQRTNLSLEDIDLLVCGLGPGSFTGVRIGIATAKAFADSKNIPVVGVNSLEELAYNLNTQGFICSLIDAGHGNTYAGFFEIDKDQAGNLQTVQEDLTFLNLTDEKGKVTEKKLIEFLIKNVQKSQNNFENKKIYFVGNSTIAYKELFQNLDFTKIPELNKKVNSYELSNEEQNDILGITASKLGYTKYQNGKSGDSSILSPVYLRKSQAEIALEEKRKQS